MAEAIMDCITKVKSDKIFYVFDKVNEPVVKVDLPQKLVVQTRDCFSGNIRSEQDTLEAVEHSTVNPTTGPIYFNNAEVGDVLEIKILKIKTYSPGFTMAVPNEGLLGDIIKEPITKIYEFDDEYVKIGDNIKIKTEPMIGIIGVAPAGEGVGTISPGDHGGNMDTKLIREGSTVYLPVMVEGGLLGVGDLHAAMGDGESWYMGLEVSGEVELDVEIRKDLKIDIPFVKTEDKLASISSESGIDDALKKAMLKLLNFMVDNGNIDFNQAGFIASLCANLEISQVVDPLVTVRMSIPLYVLDQIGINL